MYLKRQDFLLLTSELVVSSRLERNCSDFGNQTSGVSSQYRFVEALPLELLVSGMTDISPSV